jgi:hypothetical protein
MKRLRLLASVVCVWLNCTAQAQPTSFVVVVGQQSSRTKLSSYDISNVFLGRVESLPGSGDIKPIELKDEDELRLFFHTEMTGMSEHKLRSHWAAMVFTGKAKPPLRFPSLDSLKARLREDAQAIAYIRRQDLDASLKQVFP